MREEDKELSYKIQEAIKQSKRLAYERVINGNPYEKKELLASERKKRISERLSSRDENLSKFEYLKNEGEIVDTEHIKFEYQKESNVIIYSLAQRNQNFKPSLMLIKGSDGDLVKIIKNEKLDPSLFVEQKKVLKKDEPLMERGHLSLVK